jgi:hypothetical protein
MSSSLLGFVALRYAPWSMRLLVKGNGLFVFRIIMGETFNFFVPLRGKKMSGQTTQLRGINTQYENERIG